MTSRCRSQCLGPPYRTVDSCPAPTCACAATPEGLDIDRKLPLEGTKPPYQRHLVVCTGRSDWTSRIENDETTPNLAKGLKALLGVKGPFYHPQTTNLITYSSFEPGSHDAEEAVSVLLFPDHKYYPDVSVGEAGLAEFIKNVLQCSDKSRLGADINSITILICGHGGRDERCGILGPLLELEFRRCMERADMMPTSKQVDEGKEIARSYHGKFTARIGLVSHVGGHKWAGNVIIYFPHKYRTNPVQRRQSPLAGRGIWYGRVEPRHVEGIINETIKGGRVIKELFRGVTEPGKRAWDPEL